MKLKDGRTLGYGDYGATSEADSKVVLHCNGSGGSRLEWPGNETMLQSLGIRFLSVDRPGHGLSDPHPNSSMLDFTQDMSELLDHLDVGSFYVEGWSAGGSYALAMAHEFPDRVIAAATLSGIGPYDRPDPYQGVNEQVGDWMRDARAQNETAIVAFRQQLEGFLASQTASQVGAMLSAGLGEDDLEVAQRPDLQELMGANIKEGYVQGASGPAHDDLVINRPWGFRLQDVKPHVDVWQGEVDQNVPLNQGVYQDSILPNSTLHVLNNTAHLFPLTRWEEILTLLTSRTNPNIGSKDTSGNDQAELGNEQGSSSGGSAAFGNGFLAIALALSMA